MEEIWKAISGFEGSYEVSNTGKVRGLDRVDNRGYQRKGKVLRPDKFHRYPQVFLCTGKHSEMVRRYVHDLVLEAFVGPKPDGFQVNHKNGNKQDNHIENLEYVTASENIFHTYRTLERRAPNRENHGAAKLRKQDVEKIRELYDTGGYQQKELAEMFSVSRSRIHMIVHFKAWA